MLKRPKVLLGENFLFGPSLKLSFFLGPETKNCYPFDPT